MLRVSRLADYATVLLTALARQPEALQSAAALAEAARLEAPTVSKVLKLLAQAGLVQSQRGAAGGYRLARPPQQINLADVVSAIEGPIGLTECSTDGGQCCHVPHCGIRNGWQRISSLVESTLSGVSIADLLLPASVAAQRPAQAKVQPLLDMRRHG